MRKLFLTIGLSFLSFSAFAEVVAISHPSASLTLSDVKKSYIGKGKLKAIENTPLKDEFCEALLGSSTSSIDKKMSRMVFSGRATAPEVLGSDADVIKKVASDPKAIGYIKETSLTDSVKRVQQYFS